MPERRRRRHEQLAVDDLVPVAVVWQVPQIVEGPLPAVLGSAAVIVALREPQYDLKELMRERRTSDERG